MKHFHSIYFIFILSVLITFFGCQDNKDNEKPTISFSFDDGDTSDFPNYSNEEWNLMLLNKLAEKQVKSVLFVKGKNLDNKRGKEIISSWNESDHLIANHTYTHPYFNSSKVTLEKFKQELIKNDSLINKYSNYTKLFRFPYLKEGNTVEKRDGFRFFLKEKNYRIGHVTIDASDWYINHRLLKRLKINPKADISGFRDYYLQHIFNRAQYYNKLGKKLVRRNINHNLLLHHNMTSALFIDDLMKHFKDNGWEIIDAKEAFKDPVYNKIPTTIPAGESLLWALAKQSKQFDSILRYPAEDSRYEKMAMDILEL